MANSKKQHRLTFIVVLCLCAVSLLVVALLSVALGAVRVEMGAVADAVWGRGDPKDALILLHVRLPRTLGAVLAGAALAVAGVIIQTVLDNPLAGPNIIGVNAGAGFFVVLCAALFPAAFALIPVAAFLGALFALLFSYLIGYKAGASRMTLILAGVAVSSLLNAGVEAVITLYPDALVGSNTFRVGGLAGVTLKQLFPAEYIIMGGIVCVLLLGQEMDVLNLGDDAAKSLGLSVGIYRFLLLAIAAALVGSAVSFVGLIGFVGLIIPHVGRMLVGQQSRKLIVVSALLGAIFAVLCDVLARVIFAPFEIPLGIVLSFIGAPIFVIMLFKLRKGRARDAA